MMERLRLGVARPRRRLRHQESQAGLLLLEATLRLLQGEAETRKVTVEVEGRVRNV